MKKYVFLWLTLDLISVIQQRPLDYGMPMAVEYEKAHDLFITEDIYKEMVSINIFIIKNFDNRHKIIIVIK